MRAGGGRASQAAHTLGIASDTRWLSSTERSRTGALPFKSRSRKSADPPSNRMRTSHRDATLIIPCPCSHASMLQCSHARRSTASKPTQQNRECFLLGPSPCAARVAVRRGMHVIVPCTSFCHRPSRSFTGPAGGFVVGESAASGGCVAVEGAPSLLAACAVLGLNTVQGTHVPLSPIRRCSVYVPAPSRRTRKVGGSLYEGLVRQLFRDEAAEGLFGRRQAARVAFCA